MAIPSGILWRAIAKANFNPSIGLDEVEMNVAMPSGRLWMIIVKSDSIPRLYNLSLVLFWAFL